MRYKRLLLLGMGLLVAASAQAQTSPGPMPRLHSLDSTYAVAGLRFGTPEGTTAWLRGSAAGVGKRWKATHVYRPVPDTITFSDQHRRIQPDFWFRGGQFIGITFLVPEQKTGQPVLHYLTEQYGPPRPGNVAGAHYWLGTRTYILYEALDKSTTMVHIASLAMLNEQVVETSVRRDARTTLGWQPDSLGLPRQFPVPAETKKK